MVQHAAAWVRYSKDCVSQHHIGHTDSGGVPRLRNLDWTVNRFLVTTLLAWQLRPIPCSCSFRHRYHVQCVARQLASCNSLVLSTAEKTCNAFSSITQVTSSAPLDFSQNCFARSRASQLEAGPALGGSTCAACTLLTSCPANNSVSAEDLSSTFAALESACCCRALTPP